MKNLSLQEKIKQLSEKAVLLFNTKNKYFVLLCDFSKIENDTKNIFKNKVVLYDRFRLIANFDVSDYRICLDDELKVDLIISLIDLITYTDFFDNLYLYKRDKMFFMKDGRYVEETDEEYEKDFGKCDLPYKKEFFSQEENILEYVIPLIETVLSDNGYFVSKLEYVEKFSTFSDWESRNTDVYDEV